MRFLGLIPALLFALAAAPGEASIRIESADPAFEAMVRQELGAIRSGERGLVLKSLMDRLEGNQAVTTIRPLTADESTWHSNDMKGTRSHVVARDTKVRGAERDRPTDADVYVHPTRVDPSLSLFKLGTFVHVLATAADLNDGEFSPDYRIREKRAAFYRNAWLDALGLRPIEVSDRVPTPEYSTAKENGLLVEENVALFPLIQPQASPSPDPTRKIPE